MGIVVSFVDIMMEGIVVSYVGIRTLNIACSCVDSNDDGY